MRIADRRPHIMSLRPYYTALSKLLHPCSWDCFLVEFVVVCYHLPEFSWGSRNMMKTTTTTASGSLRLALISTILPSMQCCLAGEGAVSWFSAELSPL